LHDVPSGPRGAILRRLEKEIDMLWTIAVILMVLWVLGLVSSYTMGGAIHALLVIAVIVILFQVISGRKVRTL
jgi:hypothetical protein